MKKNFKINKRARRDMLCPNGPVPDKEQEEELLEQQFEAKRLKEMEKGGDGR